ncbi:MAG: PorP/SprF family type IX secretion system membrane protein [Saprospirales bacterium]|nr:PorP/SprF family type IX secretion system membrane protein [Saprospirales bacterium]
MRACSSLPILISLLLLASRLPAQQIPFLNHYTWNPRLFNPASQGAGESGEIVAVFRSQFSSLEASDRPNTYLVHADLSPLLNERIGLAAQVLGDKAHLLSRFQFTGFFGYHLIQRNNLRFSLGATAGISSFSFNFDGARVGDVLDLAVFYGQINRLQFDGGPGLALEYQTDGGSLLSFDAAATQLFSSDIRIQGDPQIAQEGALYDLVPHILVNARYRFQGGGFALEPNIVYRALAGGRPLSHGVFELNLNAYFLKDNRLMAGVGMRTNGGGLHFQLGVAPAPAVRLIASAEMHSALGTTYEVGASYAFGKSIPQPPAPPPANSSASDNLLSDAYQEVQSIASAMEPQIFAVRGLQDHASGVIGSGLAERSRKKQTAAADSCTDLLTQAARDLQRLRQMANAIDVKRLQAEQAVRNAPSRGTVPAPATLATLQAIKTRNAEVNGQLETLVQAQQFLLQQCAGLRPEFSEAACVRSGDAECLGELLSGRLETVPGRPANLYPLRIFAVPGAAAITYHYPDDGESYALTPEFQILAGHVANQLAQMQQQGLALNKLTLVAELQEDKSTLGYRPGLVYDGAAGNAPLAYMLIDNATGAAAEQTLTLPVGTPVDLESLAALKLAALWQYFTAGGIPAGQINLEVRYNHDQNIYREETKIVLRMQAN